MLIFKVLWKGKCVTEVSCVYILVFGRVVFIFPYQMYHRTFSASCGSDDARPDQTGPDWTGAAAGSDGCSRSIYCTMCPILPSCCFCLVFLPLTFTTEWHSCSKALLSRWLSAGRRGGALLIDRGSFMSLVCGVGVNNFWQTEPVGRSLVGGRVPAIRDGHSSFQHSCRVSCRLYAICFAHCVHIYIDVRHIFLYTCTTDGISIL